MEKWYALSTKTGCERKVSDALTKKKIENYCPVMTGISSAHWWNFGKNEKVVFDSRVFVKVHEDKIAEVKKCPGVINILYWLDHHAIIEEPEINSIRNFLAVYKSFFIEKTSVKYKETALSVVVISDGYNETGLSNSMNVDIPTLGLRLCAVFNTEVYSIQNARGVYAPGIQPHKHAI